jgi:hypothetical protein
MKNTKIAVALAASGHAAMPGGANPQTFPPTMAAQTRSPEEPPNSLEHEDESADRRGAAFWWWVLTFFVQGFAAYAASMHPTAAYSVEALLTAARRPQPRSAGRTPIAAAHERGPV